MNNLQRWLTCTVLLVAPTLAAATVVMTPTLLDDAQYDAALLNGSYSDKVTHPEQLLGFPVGQRTATPAQITSAVTTWSEQSDRIALFEYARSYEGRPLHYLAISSPDNLARLDAVRADINRLANTNLTSAERDALIDRMPATAWMAYSIHGNESSGADAALALIYHLAAGQDPEVTGLLDDMIVFVDPMMNPDGRARFTKMLEQHRGSAPNVDTQSMLHSGSWPWGRTNHYYFDLNRDFYFLVNPESQGRVAAINQWYPQLMIDGHEMGSLNTYLFGPPREPINPHIPASKKRWGQVFAADQATAFDQNQWGYYTGEWFENLYPGYSNYAEYRGSIHILYEQASTDEDGIRLPNGAVRSYRQSVHQQLTSSLANLATLHKHRVAIYRDFVADRAAVRSADGAYANRSFVVLPTENRSRLDAFVERMQRQGIELYRADSSFRVSRARDQLGRRLNNTAIPEGALIIPNRQNEGRLIAAILEFDTAISDDVLLEERQRTLRDGSSLMYDTTAWNLTMMYGLAALEVPQHLSRNLSPWTQPETAGQILGGSAGDQLGWFTNGNDDRSVAFAARLMEQDVQVRVLDKATVLGAHTLPRGSVVVSREDNRRNAQLPQLVAAAAAAAQINATVLARGLGEGDNPDIGGAHFRLLTKPSIAVLTYDNINFYDTGAIWHLIDTQLGVRHSRLNKSNLNFADLRRYNVIVVPDTFGGGLDEAEQKVLRGWVEQGGTLIAIDGSARSLASTDGTGNTKLLADTMDEADRYNLLLQRQWLAREQTLRNNDKINNFVVPDQIDLPWSQEQELKGMDAETLKKWEKWTANFMPAGAIVAGDVDPEHWLGFGVGDVLPLLYADAPVLMSGEGSAAVVRVGHLADRESAEAKKIGWSTVPKGKELRLRMSGLLWPEAAQRIANSAYLTQESSGNGQVILFSGQPVFRGAAKGTARLLLNAMVYGPGMGASAPLKL